MEDGVGAGLDGAGDVEAVGEGGEDEDASAEDGGHRGFVEEADDLGAVAVGETEVDDGDVEGIGVTSGEELAGIGDRAGLGGGGDVLLAVEHEGEGLAKGGMVVEEDEADHRLAVRPPLGNKRVIVTEPTA